MAFVDTLCVIYRKLGQFDAALQLLDEAEAARPNEPLLKFQLGMIHSAQGDAIEAHNLPRTALMTSSRPGLGHGGGFWARVAHSRSRSASGQ